MFSRLEHDIPAVLFPKDWAESLKQILLNIYGEKCLKDDKSFAVYGLSYPKEVLMIVSYVGLDQNVFPVTLHLSVNLDEKTNSSAVLDNLFDFVGVFFDAYFAKEENADEIWDDYVLDWENAEFSGQEFYYKVTRENIGLSMEADLLLGE